MESTIVMTAEAVHGSEILNGKMAAKVLGGRTIYMASAKAKVGDSIYLLTLFHRSHKIDTSKTRIIQRAVRPETLIAIYPIDQICVTKTGNEFVKRYKMWVKELPKL